MLNYETMTRTDLLETLKSLQSARSMNDNERERLVHELQVHQIELEMQNEELRETQQQLEETGNLYADLYDFAPVGYISFDDNGLIQEINLTGTTMLGIERSRLKNMPFATFVIQSDLPKFWDHLCNCRQTKEKTTTEIGLISKEGKFQVQMSSIAISDPKRHLTLYRTAFSDITERKLVEEALQRTKDELEIRVKERTAELTKANADLQMEITGRKQVEKNLAAEKERLSVTLFSIGDGVITTDTEGKIVLMNQVAESLTGWVKETAGGQLISEVFHITNDKTGEPYEDLILKSLETSEIINLEMDVALISKNGLTCLITFNIAPIRDLQNNNIGAVLVFHDITNQRRLEKEFLKIQKLESLGILAGGIAHDFNNFLAGILASTQLSKMMLNKGKDITINLDNIEKAITSAAGLTKQLLTFAKGGAPVKKVAAISGLIKDTVYFALRGSNVRGELSIPDDLWLAEIDEGQINQVINNLVINADQAMPEGGIIKVSAENIKMDPRLHHHSLQPGDYVKITITDQGVGIPEEILPYIFDPYFTTKQKGNGLGLTSSYAIIKKHNGCLEVESSPGIGATFYIYLPASFAADEVAANKEELVLKGTGKILLMDDEANIRNVAGDMLTQIGYQVEPTEDGAAAIALYTRAKESGVPFDLVIMDLTIPGGMGGKETLKKLIQIDPGIKAIVSSGYSNDPIMSNYHEYGFCGVVTKPYRIEELHQKLHTLLNETGPLAP
jgi:PAS domain S-box-containing protein